MSIRPPHKALPTFNSALSFLVSYTDVVAVILVKIIHLLPQLPAAQRES